MFSSSCKPVPTTNLFGNIDILYLLSHVYSVSLSMGRINSKFFCCFFCFFYKTQWYLWLSSNILNSKQVNIDMGWIMKQHWYTPLLHWWPSYKRCACTLIKVSWRLSNLGWLQLYKCAKLYTVETFQVQVYFHSRKCIWNCRQEFGGHFVSKC